jgi:TetR/AcrR family transcriptional regulator
MVAKKDQNTEKLILEAARTVFERKGFDGARMQEIADEAGINKALLHYYFRSKEKLFDNIFHEAFGNFWPSIEAEINGKDATVKDLIKAAVNAYTDMLLKMPFLPGFIVGEINRFPERVEELLRSTGIKPDFVIGIIKRGIDKGEIIDIDPRELIINIVGLSIFPYLSRPVLWRMLYGSPEEYDKFLENRRKTLYEFICRSILIE